MTNSRKQRVILYPTITGKFYVHRCIKPGPKSLPPELKERRVNIALSPHWHEKGKQKAAEKGLSLAATLNRCLMLIRCVMNQAHTMLGG